MATQPQSTLNVSPLELFTDAVRAFPLDPERLERIMKDFFDQVMSDVQKQAVVRGLAGLEALAGEPILRCDPWAFFRFFKMLTDKSPLLLELFDIKPPGILLRVDEAHILVYGLYELVEDFGGLLQVERDKLYGVVGARLGLPTSTDGHISSSATACIRMFCAHGLNPFHELLIKIRDTIHKVFLWQAVLGAGDDLNQLSTAVSRALKEPSTPSATHLNGRGAVPIPAVFFPLFRLTEQGRRYVGFSNWHLNCLHEGLLSLTAAQQARMKAVFQQQQAALQ